MEKDNHYWDKKDYNMDFGAMLGLAFKVAWSIGEAQSDEELIERTYHIFKTYVKIRTDPRFIDLFNEYYQIKGEGFKINQKLPTIEFEKK